MPDPLKAGETALALGIAKLLAAAAHERDGLPPETKP